MLARKPDKIMYEGYCPLGGLTPEREASLARTIEQADGYLSKFFDNLEATYSLISFSSNLDD